MRITLPVAFLLIGASSAQGQTDTSGFAVAPTVPAEAPAPARSLPAAAPAPALPAASTQPQASAHAEAVTAAPAAQPEQPRKRSRVLWILVGAVAVLAIIVAAR
jgi:hypothetical protein